MYPMWLTSVKESMRFMSVCATAPSTPVSMVASATHISSVETGPPGNSSASSRMIE